MLLSKTSNTINGLNFDKGGSVDNMTEEEIAVNFDPVEAARTGFPIFFQMQPVIKVLAQTCLFDDKVTSEFLP